MYGLVEVDVTKAKQILARHDPPSSLTAFVIASVARAAAAHPEVHAYRNWRGQLVTHQHVDVTTIVEISTPQGPFGLPCTLHDADIREVPDLTAELRRVKREPLAGGVQLRDTQTGFMLELEPDCASLLDVDVTDPQGKGTRIVNLRKFEPLVWTRVEN